MKRHFLFIMLILSARLLTAQVLNVPGDFSTIQAAINAANQGETVRVAPGIYYEQINFLGKKPLLVTSHFADEGDTSFIANTILDGDSLSNPDSSSVVLFISGEDSTSTLCGFTVRHGKGTKSVPENSLSGGGILIKESGAKVSNCHITDNIINMDYNPALHRAFGAGIMGFGDSLSWIVIVDNLIDSNTTIATSAASHAGGAGAFVFGNSRIFNNKFLDNLSKNPVSTGDAWWQLAGGLHIESYTNWNSLSIVRNNLISHNKTYGNYALGAGATIWQMRVIFEDNIISGNKTGTLTSVSKLAGGGLWSRFCIAGSAFRKNTFINNFCEDDGGAMWLEDFEQDPSMIQFEDNYFIGNKASDRGGAFCLYHFQTIFKNNVFSHNEAPYYGIADIDNTNTNQAFHDLLFINNTFGFNKSIVGNTANLMFRYSYPLFLNDIFWQNISNVEFTEIYTSAGHAEMAYSNINQASVYGQTQYGDGMLNLAPIFQDTTLLSLFNYGPCVDAGIASLNCAHDQVFNAPDHDILGNPRPAGTLYDMGAYEIIASPQGLSDLAINEGRVRVFPNPFWQTAEFEYDLKSSTEVMLIIYNQLGGIVGEPVNERQDAGTHRATWNAESMSAGIYFIVLQTEGQSIREKLILVK